MIEKLKNSLDKNTAALIVDPANRRYYTGMNTSNGYIVATADKACFFTDFRYITAAKNKVYKNVSVALIEKRMGETIKEYLAGLGIKTVLFEENYLSYAMADGVKQALPEYEFKGGQKLISSFREIKTADEIAATVEAQKITDASFLHICDYIHENKNKGITEKDIALELEFDMRKKGSGAMPFSIIVASGENSALPHAVPSDRQIREGDFVTMDYGSTFGGYCSDMTRTIAVCHVTDEMKKIYDTVLEAQLTAIKGIKAGIIGKDADSLARDVIVNTGYGQYFGHSLGHSVGLEVHESPNFSQGYLNPIPENAILSVEPGIYIEGFCGVRIEDLVVVKKDGVEDITGSDKSLIIL